MSEENIILTCPHCGNKTLMKLLNKFEKDTRIPYGYEEAQFVDIFEVFECPVCKGFHLYYTNWSSEESYPENHDIYEEGEVLFPTSERVNLNRLPINIKNAYESALKVRNIDDTVCLLALRRTLEMVCKDKGAEKGSLYDKLKKLQNEGTLPPLMGDISKVIKDFGNMAAHGDDVTFDKYLVERMFSFTNKILEYVYILPKEMKRAQMELGRLSQEAKSKTTK